MQTALSQAACVKFYESPGFLFCYLLTLGPIIPLELSVATFLFLFLNQEEKDTPALMSNVIDLDGAATAESAVASKSQAAIAASVLVVVILLQVAMAASIVVQRSLLSTRSKYRALLPFAARSEGYEPVGTDDVVFDGEAAGDGEGGDVL